MVRPARPARSSRSLPCPGGGSPMAEVGSGQRMLATGRTADGAWLRVHFPAPGRSDGWVGRRQPSHLERAPGRLPIVACVTLRRQRRRRSRRRPEHRHRSELAVAAARAAVGDADTGADAHTARRRPRPTPRPTPTPRATPTPRPTQTHAEADPPTPRRTPTPTPRPTPTPGRPRRPGPRSRRQRRTPDADARGQPGPGGHARLPSSTGAPLPEHRFGRRVFDASITVSSPSRSIRTASTSVSVQRQRHTHTRSSSADAEVHERSNRSRYTDGRRFEVQGRGGAVRTVRLHRSRRQGQRGDDDHRLGLVLRRAGIRFSDPGGLTIPHIARPRSQDRRLPGLPRARRRRGVRRQRSDRAQGAGLDGRRASGLSSGQTRPPIRRLVRRPAHRRRPLPRSIWWRPAVRRAPPVVVPGLSAGTWDSRPARCSILRLPAGSIHPGSRGSPR